VASIRPPVIVGGFGSIVGCFVRSKLALLLLDGLALHKAPRIEAHYHVLKQIFLVRVGQP